jgi:hypothetical protein
VTEAGARTAGEAAYAGFCRSSDGRSRGLGQPPPAWGEQPAPAREAWEDAAGECLSWAAGTWRRHSFSVIAERGRLLRRAAELDADLARVLAQRDRLASDIASQAGVTPDTVLLGLGAAPGPGPDAQWAVLELTGHRTAIGLVAERTLAGRTMLHVQRTDGIVQWYSPDALRALTRCTREQAEAAARHARDPGLPRALCPIADAEDPQATAGHDATPEIPDGDPADGKGEGNRF